MAASMSDDRDAHHGMSGWDYAAEAQKMTGDFEAESYVGTNFVFYVMNVFIRVSKSVFIQYCHA